MLYLDWESDHKSFKFIRKRMEIDSVKNESRKNVFIDFVTVVWKKREKINCPLKSEKRIGQPMNTHCSERTLLHHVPSAGGNRDKLFPNSLSHTNTFPLPIRVRPILGCSISGLTISCVLLVQDSSVVPGHSSVK